MILFGKRWTMTSLEIEFESAMLDIYEQAKRYKYYPTYFVRIVYEYGRVGAARRLLAAPTAQEGLTKLWETKRLDLSMENLVRQERFQSLFTVEEIITARQRLEDLGFLTTEPKARMPEISQSADEATALKQLVSKGESATLEFKETLEVDNKTGAKFPALVQSSLKTIAAYLNTNGGILLIGVANDGQIKGVERDYAILPKNKNADGLELKLRDLIHGHFDPVPLGDIHITFVETQHGTVCRVEAQKSAEVIHYDDAVYVRDGNRTLKLEGRELTDWLRRRL